MALVTIQGALPLLTLYLIKLIVDAVTVSLGAPDKMEAHRCLAELHPHGSEYAIRSKRIFGKMQGLPFDKPLSMVSGPCSS